MSRDITKPTKWLCAQRATTWQNQQNPPSLISVFAVCMKKAWVLSYPLSAQRRVWSEWADFVSFVMLWLILCDFLASKWSCVISSLPNALLFKNLLIIPETKKRVTFYSIRACNVMLFFHHFYLKKRSPKVSLQDKTEPYHDKTNEMTCTQRRLRSAWASAQSDQSSLCIQWVAKDPRFLDADSEEPDQTGRCPGWSESLLDAQTICWFCHVPGQMLKCTTICSLDHVTNST